MLFLCFDWTFQTSSMCFHNMKNTERCKFCSPFPPPESSPSQPQGSGPRSAGGWAGRWGSSLLEQCQRQAGLARGASATAEPEPRSHRGAAGETSGPGGRPRSLPELGLLLS